MALGLGCLRASGETGVHISTIVSIYVLNPRDSCKQCSRVPLRRNGRVQHENENLRVL